MYLFRIFILSKHRFNIFDKIDVVGPKKRLCLLNCIKYNKFTRGRKVCRQDRINYVDTGPGVIIV